MQFAFKEGAIFEYKHTIAFCLSILEVPNKQRPISFEHPTQTVRLSGLYDRKDTLLSCP